MPVLHSYQEVAKTFAERNNKMALFLDCGLGKTAVSLKALTPAHLPVLVAAPPKVAANVWPFEKVIWRPDLSLAAAVGDPNQRAKAFAQHADITSLSHASLADAIGARDWKTIIIDELSAFKDGTTTRFKVMKQLSKDVEHVWGLTGTPSPNGLMNLWSQIFLLDRGERLGKNITTFRNRYFTPGARLPSGTIIEWNLRPGAEEQIWAAVSDICLSMSAEGNIELPPVTYNTIYIDLPKVVKEKYKEFKKDLVTDLEVLGGEIHTAASAGVLTSKLSQVTAGFLYPDADAEVRTIDYLHDLKIKAVESILEETGRPVIVAYHFKEELAMLKAKFPWGRSVNEKGVINEWNFGEVQLMFCQPQSAGHGLNLQHGGSTMIWMTGTWDLELYEQMIKRLIRQGQKNSVIIHNIVARGTVDELQVERIISKQYTQNRLLEHLSSPV